MTLKNKYLLFFMGVVVLLQIIANAVGLCYNVDSIYDEGFLYYCQQSAVNGAVGGMSQNTNIIATLFWKNGCDTIWELRLARFFLTLLTTFLFVVFSAQLFVKDWKGKIGYGIVCLLLVVPILDGIILSYNGLAQFFDCLALVLGYRVLTIDSRWNYLWCVLMGALLVFGFFSILPSAVLLMGCLVILLVIRYWKESKRICLYVGATIGGVLFGLLLFHLCLVNLGSVFDAMQETAHSVTTLNRGYDPISFVAKIMLFLRDWVLMGLVIIGAILVSQKISDNTRKWIGGVVLMVLMLVYAYYQVKPKVSTAMLMSGMWIGLLFDKSDKTIWKEKLNFDTLLNLFLASVPLILSIGTNTYLGDKMSYFLLPWALLLYRLGWHTNETMVNGVMSLFVGLWLSIGLIGVPKMMRSQNTVVNNGPLRGMHLTNKQAEHFALCDSIMRAYDYKEQESVVFTTQLGTMTNCYMNAKSYGNYFQPMDFVANPRLGKPSPDFLFLCEYDENVAGKQLRQMGWGWPEEYDVFDVGTPESKVVGYPTTRKLYCKKIKDKL